MQTQRNGLLGLVAVLSVALLVVSGFYAVAVLGPASAGANPETNSETQKNTLTVTGSGTWTTKPDQATINVGVVTQASTASEALSQNSVIMNEVIASLLAAGVPEDKIKTSGFSIYPIYSDYKEQQISQIVAYRVNNMVSATTENLEIVGELIDKAVAAGANEIHGVYFGLSEEGMKSIRNQAISKAVADAREKADLIASGLNVQILGVLTVTEQGSYYPPIIYRGAEFAQDASTPVQPGTLDVTYSVQVVYVIG
ncbi:MAG: SIMPL domain-containing protein [Aigarchaeota archaeon]|nr:SIMPL domain-containing protein [Aigarchaeota archaeon]MDH5703089.1 SIMPL domain-containing protein [Aigarchaeota archaeon]